MCSWYKLHIRFNLPTLWQMVAHLNPNPMVIGTINFVFIYLILLNHATLAFGFN
jgi:hypothetical protein